jgi:hypothetical protein
VTDPRFKPGDIVQWEDPADGTIDIGVVCKCPTSTRDIDLPDRVWAVWQMARRDDRWDWRVAWGAAGWCTLLDKNDPRVSKFKTEFAAQLLTEGEPKLWNETFY